MATSRVRTRALEHHVEGTVIVHVVPFRGASTEEKVEKLDVHKFVTDPAYVRVSAGVTKSTGDYESLRVDVAVTYPCYPEQVEETYTRLSDFVAEKLDREIEEYLGSGA